MIAEVVLYISAATNVLLAIESYRRVRKLRLQPKPQTTHTHSLAVIAVWHFKNQIYGETTFTSVLSRCHKCGHVESRPVGGMFTLEDFTVTSAVVDDALKRMEKSS